MPREILDIQGVHPTGGSYSHAARAGGTVYIAGQVAKDRDNQIIGKGDIDRGGQRHRRHRRLSGGRPHAAMSVSIAAVSIIGP